MDWLVFVPELSQGNDFWMSETMRFGWCRDMIGAG